jgi:hypothetical protein
MKKTFSVILLSTSIFASEVTDAIGDVASSIFASGMDSLISSILGESDISKSIGMCYESDISIPNISGMCSALDFQINESVNICAGLPNIPGLTKKSNTQALGFGTTALKNYCSKTTDQKLASATSNGEIWSVDNDFEGDSKFPSGDTKEDFYAGNAPVLNITKLNKEQNSSIAGMYLSSKDPNHQQTAKYLIDLAKIKKVDDVTKITVDDVKAAENMIEYENQVTELSAAITSDMKVSSTNSISSILSNKLSSYKDSTGQEEQNKIANAYAKKIKTMVEKTAISKKGLYKSLLVEKDDLAVPTQQTLNLYKDNIKPKYAMIIRKQQNRDSYISALIDEEVQIKKDIIDLSAKKAVIMKFQFDSDAAMNEIDNFVN